MKVSIIIATFNSKDYVGDCLDSILNQDYQNIEIIVVDGNSDDNTLAIIKSKVNTDTKINILSEEDNGIYDALNKGINLSTGDVVGFVHSDDFLATPMIISEIINKMCSEQLDGVYGDLHYVKTNEVSKIFRKWISCDFDFNLLSKGWMPAHPTFFLKKSVYNKHGLFDLIYSISGDYDFMLRILTDKSLKFGYLPKVITNMRVGGISNRNLKNIIMKTKEDFLAIKNNKIGGFLTLILKNTSKIRQFF